jgi:hypothetical protein
MGFLSKTHIWEDSCNHPDDVDSHPNALMHEVSHAFKIKTSVLVFVLAAFCWTKSLLCNVVVFTGMLLYPESNLQLCSSRRFCEVFKEVYFGSLSAVWTTWYSVRTLISQQHPSRRRDIPSGRSSVSNICPDNENFPSGCPSVSRSFEQFKIASVRK